ncbi:transposase, IS116/IS110/IS902 domain protein [Leptospira interrogans serovar Bataviae str. UI 08561]|nr:transposase, IS116/IS110/IS902 domain protein [Leptospira interrogans serovar Bataviae str. UI 08561]
MRSFNETFNDYYSRVRVQEENLKAMDQKIQEIAKSEAFRERVGILRCFRGVDYLTAMFLLSEVNDFRRFKTAGSFIELFRYLFLENIPAVRKENKQGLQKREVRDLEGF